VNLSKPRSPQNKTKNCRLFRKIDLDNDGKLERGELQAFIIGVKFEDVDLDSDLAVDQVMADFDTSHNSVIEKGEFIEGILRWLEEAKRSVATSGSDSKKFLQDFHTVRFSARMHVYQVYFVLHGQLLVIKLHQSAFFFCRGLGMSVVSCLGRTTRTARLLKTQPGPASRPFYFCSWELQWQQRLQTHLLTPCTVSQTLRASLRFSSLSLQCPWLPIPVRLSQQSYLLAGRSSGPCHLHSLRFISKSASFACAMSFKDSRLTV
jgi:hypothetical protein